MKVKLTPKQYLNQGYRLNELIESNLEELRMLHATIDGISAIRFQADKVQTSSSANIPEEMIFKIMTLEEKIDAETDRFFALKTEIRDEIAKVPDPTERLVLRLRYVQFKSWPDIQGIIGKKERRVYVIHSTALNHFKVPDTPFAYQEI